MINDISEHTSNEEFISSAELYSRVMNALQSTNATKKMLYDIFTTHPIYGTCHAMVEELDRGRVITDLNKVDPEKAIKVRLYKPGEVTLFPANWQIQDRSKFDATIQWLKCFMAQNYVNKPLIIRNRKSKGLREEIFGSRLLVYGLRFRRPDIVTALSIEGKNICLDGAYNSISAQNSQKDGRSEHNWSLIGQYEAYAQNGELADVLGSVTTRGFRTQLTKLLENCFKEETAPSRPTLYRKAAQLIEIDSMARTAHTP